MSFGDKRLDRALDDWLTQTPEDYFGVDENENENEPERELKKDKPKEEPTADELMLKQGKCPYCKEKLQGFLMGHLNTCEAFKKRNQQEKEK